MASEWVYRRIGDIGRVVTGKTPSTSDASSFGGPYPFVTIPDLDDQVIVRKTERSVSEQGAMTIKGSLLPAGAVMMSCIATIGKCGITATPSFTNQQINSVVCFHDVYNRFLYYCFRRMKSEMEATGGGGSVYTNVSKSRFADIYVPVPPLAEQRAIARVLGALDDKIELNRRMNETLEALARALFQSWFVDFDPVRAKSEGRTPQGMDAETAVLFPGSFEASELGEIPAGWTSEPLDGVAQFLNGLALQKYPPTGENDLPVIKIAQLRQGSTEGADLARQNIPDAYIIENGDVLFSWSGTLAVSLWQGGRGALNQHLFKVTSRLYPKWFYLYWVKHYLPEFQQIAAGKATTMGHIQRHHLTAAKVAMPPSTVVQALDKIMSPLVEKMLANGIQSHSLTATRDALLPKLLSGEVRAATVEEGMETAA